MSSESKPKGKTSTYIAAAVLIIIILAGVGYYYYSTSTSMVPTTTAAPLYKNTIVMGTTDAVQTTIDPADAYDYFGINMIDNLGAPLVDFAPGTNNTGPSGLQPALATNW